MTVGPFWRDCPDVKTEEIVRYNVQISQFRSNGLDVQKKLQRLTGNVTLEQPMTNTGMVRFSHRD